MLDVLIRAALAECGRKRVFPIAQLVNVFIWIFGEQKKRGDGL